MYKQIIIVRKDLKMSSGKLAVQVSHASMAFLTSAIRKSRKEVIDCKVGYAYEEQHFLLPWDGREPMSYRRHDLDTWAKEARKRGDNYFYFEPVNENDQYGELRLCEKKYHVESTLSFDAGLYDQWINGTFTKVVLEAKNRNQLEKAITIANEMGLIEGKDYFCIRDNCLTELTPEEIDEDGVGRTLTCIGFVPMENSIIDMIGRNYQLWKD